jgi:hypothetical protein
LLLFSLPYEKITPLCLEYEIFIVFFGVQKTNVGNEWCPYAPSDFTKIFREFMDLNKDELIKK